MDLGPLDVQIELLSGAAPRTLVRVAFGGTAGVGSAGNPHGEQMRRVLGEVVHKRFPEKDVTQVFPGLSYNPINVLT